MEYTLSAKRRYLGGGRAAEPNAADPQPDDSALLRRARSGDTRAMDALCRQCWKPVYRFFARLTSNPSEAEDLTQEVFLRALRALPKYEDRGLPFAAYLSQIAQNLARDQWRARSTRLVVTADVPDRATAGPGPDILAVASDRREVVLAALDRLTPDHRAVLRLRILEGRSTSEVARLTNRSQPAVRQLQVRALTALRAALGDDLGHAEDDHERNPK